MHNYRRESGSQVVERFRALWNARLTPAGAGSPFSSALVFHLHGRELRGIANVLDFIENAKAHTRNLDFVPFRIFSHGDMIACYFRWSSERWHPDIKSPNTFSNFGQIVFRVEQDRVVEAWEQAADFIYLLGIDQPDSVIDYPRVMAGNLFIEDESGLFATADPETVAYSELFNKMNDCFTGRCSLRKIKEVQHADMVFFNGDKRGQGIEAWKAFAYALHSALGKAGTARFDDVCIRNGNSLTVLSRCRIVQPSPFALAGMNGMTGSLSFDVRDGKIQTLRTHIENYLPFLGTDFRRHDERVQSLFQGNLSPVRTVPRKTEVAVVGMAGRFPRCDSIEEFWALLSRNETAFSETPADRRYLAEGTAIRHAGFMEGVEFFDAEFFNIPPVQAEYLDPQQRMLMETIWHAVEQSGHRAADFAGGRTGLFVSTISDDYKKLLQDRGVPFNGNYWLGNEWSIFPAKIARFLDIQGPCRFINAECASALVAVHDACAPSAPGKSTRRSSAPRICFCIHMDSWFGRNNS